MACSGCFEALPQGRDLRRAWLAVARSSAVSSSPHRAATRTSCDARRASCMPRSHSARHPRGRPGGGRLRTRSGHPSSERLLKLTFEPIASRAKRAGRSRGVGSAAGAGRATRPRRRSRQLHGPFEVPIAKRARQLRGGAACSGCGRARRCSGDVSQVLQPTRRRSHRRAFGDGGDGNLPVGGLRKCPLAATGSPRRWPSVLPTIVS
jgi:hypothetical protein